MVSHKLIRIIYVGSFILGVKCFFKQFFMVGKKHVYTIIVHVYNFYTEGLDIQIVYVLVLHYTCTCISIFSLFFMKAQLLAFDLQMLLSFYHIKF